MNRSKLSIAQKIANATQIPFDAVTKMPYIKMCSNREITVEDAGRLIHYDKELVKVKQGKNTVCVSGSGLNIRCLANNDLRVEGCINEVAFDL